MKILKKYAPPKVEIYQLESSDVMQTSGNVGDYGNPVEW